MALTLFEFWKHTTLPVESFLCHGVILNLATTLRLGPRLPVIRHVQDNKYLMWFCLGLLLQRIRPIFEQELSRETMILCQVLRILMLALGVRLSAK